MSFFFFGHQEKAEFKWTIITGVNTTWTRYNPDFKDRWGDWSAFTWGQIGA